MTEQSWGFVDKSEWARGPWDSEPDKIQFTDEKTGLPCLVVRAGSGGLCGYVGTAEGHPYFGKYWDDIEDDLRVHGGLTFSDFCQEHAAEGEGICHVPGPGEPERVWWLGFDCAHAWDLTPSMLRLVSNGFWEDCVYRDVAYVREECSLLASQIAAAGR